MRKPDPINQLTHTEHTHTHTHTHTFATDACSQSEKFVGQVPQPFCAASNAYFAPAQELLVELCHQGLWVAAICTLGLWVYRPRRCTAQLGVRLLAV